jgi:hypothetical protein
MTAMMLFNLRKNLVIKKLEPISKIWGWAAPPDLKLKYSQLENKHVIVKLTLFI